MNLENPDLKKIASVDNDLKNFIVEYEENWVRGYQQGLDDVEAGKSMLEKQSGARKNCKLCESK